MTLISWLTAMTERLSEKAEKESLSWDEKLMIDLAYELYRAYRWFDEMMWKLETVWYRLDTKLFPLPKGKKDELMVDFFLRIPTRLARRELVYHIRRWDRQIKTYDIDAAIEQAKHPRDKKLYRTLWDAILTLRENYQFYLDQVRMRDGAQQSKA